MKALSKEPADRYPSGAQLSEALDRSLKAGAAFGEAIAPPATSPPEKQAESHPPQRPLPRIPAVVAAPVPVEKPASPEPSGPPTRKKPWIYIGAMVGVVALLVVVLCVGLVALQPLMNRFNAAPSATDVSPSAAITQSVVMEITQTATKPIIRTKIPAKKPAPSATPVEIYQLQLVRGDKGESLFVINLSETAFPLAGLRIQGGPKTFTGTIWGIDLLEKGQCVGMWKLEGRAPPVPPEAGQCQMVGQLQMKKKDLPGEGPLIVFYNEKQVGTCDKAPTQCVIKIPVP
jgi:hypothetical protein